MFLKERIFNLQKVFLQERLWKTAEKHHILKSLAGSGLRRSADISAASVAKKPRQKRLLEVHRFETEAWGEPWLMRIQQAPMLGSEAW